MTGPSDHPAIDVAGLVKRFGDVLAVDGISFTVAKGETAALLGGNGAGKTTTLSVLLGLLLPTAGSVRVFGEDMARHRHRVLPRMNFSSVYVDLPKRLSVRENLIVYGHLYGLDRLDDPVRFNRSDIASFSSNTAASTSYSTSMSRTAAAAISRVSAATTATRSPT